MFFAVNGGELWTTKGTVASTKLVKQFDFVNGIDDFNGTAIVRVSTDFSQPNSIWKSDGTTAGTVFVHEVNSDAFYYTPDYTMVTRGNLFFYASNSEGRRRVVGQRRHHRWHTPGQRHQSRHRDSYPYQLTLLGSQVLFAATSKAAGTELWKSDGTAPGTTLVRDIDTANGSAGISPLVGVGDSIYFSADDIEHGRELWKSDKTTGDTMMVRDIVPGSGSSGPYRLSAFKGQLYFAAGGELWKSDGTASGTVRVKDTTPGDSGTPIQELGVFGDRLYFDADDGVHGFELWTSDGTTAGTRMVKDILPGQYSSVPRGLFAVGGTLFFAADDGQHGRELWKTDGTAAGTVLVKDIVPGPDYSFPIVTAAIGKTVYFTVDYEETDPRLGRYELWKSDGTAQGTVRVKSFTTAGSVSDPVNLDGALYFTASNGVTGREPWKSDGTTAGTVIVKDLNSGSQLRPTRLHAAGNHGLLRCNHGTDR